MTTCGIASKNAMMEAATRFKPETEGTMNNVAAVEPAMVVRRGPMDMLLRLSDMLSRKETFFTRPVLSLTNAVGAFLSSGWESPIGPRKMNSVYNQALA